MIEGLIIDLFRPSDSHRVVDGVKMTSVRDQLGLSCEEFADLAGHSQQFQSQIEAPGEHIITRSKAEDIILAVVTGVKQGKAI